MIRFFSQNVRMLSRFPDYQATTLEIGPNQAKYFGLAFRYCFPANRHLIRSTSPHLRCFRLFLSMMSFAVLAYPWGAWGDAILWFSASFQEVFAPRWVLGLIRSVFLPPQVSETT